MRLRIPLLVILLTPLLTPISYAQTPLESPNTRSADYMIEPELFYPGTLVLELLQAAEVEIDTAVNEAFAEGYKAAMLQYAPELAGLRITEASLKLELEKARRKDRFFWPTVGISTGISFAAGFFIHSLVSR